MGNPGAIMGGAAIGGSLGSSIGGLIGDSNHGWHGGYRGSAIGNIIGTLAGAAIGNALTAPRQERVDDDTYAPRVRRSERTDVTAPRPRQGQRPMARLSLRNIRFIDDNRNQAIDAGEDSKIIFEIINDGDHSAFNVIPIVETVNKSRNLWISQSVMIERIEPGEGFRYTASVHAGEKLKSGEVELRVAVADENGTIADAQEFTLPTRKKLD
jgi:hypothetical protein